MSRTAGEHRTVTATPRGARAAIGADGAAVIAIAALCMGLGASLGFVPGFVATELQGDLGISRGQVGLLVSVYFGCTGLGSIMGGRLTERIGARAVVALNMALVAGAAVFGAAVGAYWALLLVAVVAGSAYALVNAGTNVAIGRAIVPERRTLAMSIKTAGVPAMAAVAAGVGPWAADRFGWRPIYVAIALLAIVAMVAALIGLDDDRPGDAARPERGELPVGFVWFAIGAFLLIAGSQPLYSWLVPYLEQSLDASPAVAGAVSATASAVGVGVMIVNGLRTDRIGPGRRVHRMVNLLALGIVATSLVMLAEAVGIGLALAGAIVGIAAQLSAIGTMHAAVVDRAPTAVARATGVTMTGYYLGALFSPAAFGALADVTDTFAFSWVGTIILLALAIPAWRRADRVPFQSAGRTS